jgi:integrase
MSAREQNNLIRKAELNNTFELIAKEWLENKSEEWSKDYCKTILTRLEKDLFPKIGQMPIKTINAPILLGALREIEKRGVFETTKRARQYAGQIFRYAIAIGKAERDPSHDIKDALKNKRVEHFKAMDLKDLPEFIKKINQNDARLFRQTCLALKLMVLTFTRKSELCNARWQEIDLKNKVWIIPAERMKMRKEHLVPLSRQALEIFQELHELNSKWEYVFVSQIA